MLKLFCGLLGKVTTLTVEFLRVFIFKYVGFLVAPPCRFCWFRHGCVFSSSSSLLEASSSLEVLEYLSVTTSPNLVICLWIDLTALLARSAVEEYVWMQKMAINPTPETTLAPSSTGGRRALKVQPG